jgi:hypothetical protein
MRIEFSTMVVIGTELNVQADVNQRPGDLDLWPWKSIRFQILLRTKYVPSLVKIHWRMLILVFTRNPVDFQGQRSRSPGQIFTIEHPCEHSRINILQWIFTKLGTYLVLKRIWNPIDFQGHRSKITVIGSNFLPRNILEWILTKLGTYLVLMRIWNPIDTRMLNGKKLTRWPWPLTLKINRVPDSLKD